MGLLQLGGRARTVRPAGGRRHLHQLEHHLAAAAPTGRAGRPVRVPHLAQSGTLLVVLSTFLDDEPARLARLWRFAGHRVVAVDVAPSLSTDGLPARMGTALRVVRMERSHRLAELRAAGVELVAWREDSRHSDVEVAFTTLARTRRRTR